MPKVYRTGWIRTLISVAERAVDDLYQLDRDMHEPDRDCSWCQRRIALSRAAKMARRQVDPIDRDSFQAEFVRKGRRHA